MTYVQKAGGASQKGYKVTRDLNYKVKNYHYSADTIPAFPVESYLTTPDNYLTKMEFELSQTHFPNSTVQSYTSTWEAIGEKLMDAEDFGNALKHTRFLRDDAEMVRSKSDSAIDAMVMAYELIKNKYQWNGKKRIFVSEPLRKTYKKGTGNCSDINLALVALLREVDLDAYPLLLSTRDHGKIFPAHPSISSFNYVAAVVITNNGSYVMDATEPFCCINILPKRCLNGKGRIISENFSKWIPLTGDKKSIQTVTYQLKLDSMGSFVGSVQKLKGEYAGIAGRNKIQNSGNMKDYIEKIENENNGLIINDYKYENLENLDEELAEQYEVTINGKANQVGDLIYFKPLFYEAIADSPFKLEKREYPVEFPYPISKRLSAQITIPEGYAIETLPEKAVIVLPGRSCKFMYSARQLGNIIIVNSYINVKKTMFLPKEYTYLKTFYEKIVNKYAEQIVLKKL